MGVLKLLGTGFWCRFYLALCPFVRTRRVRAFYPTTPGHVAGTVVSESKPMMVWDIEGRHDRLLGDERSVEWGNGGDGGDVVDGLG